MNRKQRRAAQKGGQSPATATGQANLLAQAVDAGGEDADEPAQQVHVARDRPHVNFAVVRIGIHAKLTCGGPGDGRVRASASASLGAFSFAVYSGYMVSAPPRAESSGMPYSVAKSLRTSFLPGRKLGTFPA